MRSSLIRAAGAIAAAASIAVAAAPAQAVVVDLASAGQSLSTVAYDATRLGGYYGVEMLPGTAGKLAGAAIPTVTTGGSCADPALAADLSLLAGGLCSHGGGVLHANETFALTWDPNPYNDFAAGYVERFLRDVAGASGSLSSPYAVTTQYTDAGGRAGNASAFGGGYHDGGAYPTSGCAPSGVSVGNGAATNSVCLTDAQLRAWMATMVAQNGLAGRIQPGYSPVLVALTPPGVETCLDATARLCSANSDPAGVPAQFCSYHGQTTIAGTVFEYVVQPWTAMTGCDEPDAPKLPDPVDAQTLTTDMGIRLVSPLSQAHIAAIVNPGMNGWYALNGAESADNGCVPLDQHLDSVTVGGGTYLLRREFNNGGVIVSNPFALACAPLVDLQAAFVTPSAVNPGDQIQFDASKSPSTLVVPAAGFVWDFGDGTAATGPSVVHSYGKSGTYNVKLTITDRGANTSTVTQAVQVLGAGGAAVPPTTPSTTPVAPTSAPAFHVHLQLVPQGLRSVLRQGLAVVVNSDEPADGIATLSIPRSAARQAHLSAGRGNAVVIARGTVAGIKDGAVTLRLHLAAATARKLSRLRHVAVTVRLVLASATGERVAVDTAGRY